VGDNRLQTVRDSGGFDPQLYEIQVPAGGSPRAAKEVVEALQNTSLRVTTDARRGLDHGAWAPLRDMFPAAEVPVAPLSIQHLGGRAGPSPSHALQHPRSCHRHGQLCL
jgi:4,5-DOPA dioxygenase extradiol